MQGRKGGFREYIDPGLDLGNIGTEGGIQGIQRCRV